MLEVTENTFEQEVLKSDKLTVVDFWAPWCGYCKKLMPVVEQMETEMPEVKFVKCNADEGVNISKSYAVSSLPCLLMFKNGEPQDRIVGSMPKSSMITTIKKYL